MVDRLTFEWGKYITECMESTEYCCIATVDKRGTWSNPVFFAWDSVFNLYFISQMHSRHMQNIQRNPRVAVSIYSTQQKGDVLGIKLEGNATILFNDAGAIKEAADIYYGRAGTGPGVEQYMNNPTWIFVKIVPEHLYYFDTRFFDEERQEVPTQWGGSKNKI